MDNILLSPPIAFIIYLGLVGLLSIAARWLAPHGPKSDVERSIYAGGEKASTRLAAPGYRPFFVIALFFAILHLGALVLASGGLTPLAAIFMLGLMVPLAVLILG